MSPVGLSVSGSTYILVNGQAKLWALLVGVNQYQDESLPSLHYSATDCQGLGEALTEATQEFPRKQVLIQHDFTDQTPTLEAVRANLAHIVSAAKPLDTVLFYFSGHGLLEPQSQQVFLCLSDTRRDALAETGFPLSELLALLDGCAARQELIWLDACHSGSLSLHDQRQEGFSPMPGLVQALQAYAAQSRHFYALLSCDEGQQSWEFPDLGHGLFTYYLMRGLRGEAASIDGTIEADGLYKYVYYQTKEYIRHTNQELRLLNHQKQQQGETVFYPEYPRQTPKRIVVGTGDLILGLNPDRIGLSHPSQSFAIAELEAEPVPTSEPTLASAAFLEISNQKQVLQFPLQQEVHRLGRDRQWADLVVPKHEWDIFSRRQATLHREDGNYRIYDGDGRVPSRNGIFHDRTRISPEGYLLEHGTTLEIGQDPNHPILLTFFNPTVNQPFILPSKRRLGLRNLEEFPVVLGREPQTSYAFMQLESPIVSRRHATLQRRADGTYQLENHSANGTFVNSNRIAHPVTLAADDRIQIGPFTLLFRDDALELCDRGEQIYLDAYRLQRRVKDKAGEKLILDEVSLTISPGQLVAIVGGSGTGKSMLLKTLMGIEPTTSGAVFLNDDDLRQHFDVYRTHIGYVKDESVQCHLTVAEVLLYACKLRLPPDTDVKEVVKRTLSQMMLSHVKNSLVRDLSKGQRQRVSIGVELLANPKLLFLDELTAGLDPGQDKERMKLLRELADQGRTVILVAQATPNLEVCDRIAFMGQGGRLCYFGSPKAALSFFEMPFEDLKYFADIYRKLDPGTSKQDTEAAISYWLNKFRNSPEYQADVQVPLHSDTTSSTTQARNSSVTSWRQLCVLCQRQWQLVWRHQARLLLLISPIAVGLIFLVQDELSTQASLLRVLLVLTGVVIWVGLSSSVQDIVSESAIYARERLINLGLLPYLGSKFLVRAGLAILQSLLMVITLLIGFNALVSSGLFGAIGLGITTFLTLLSSVSLGLMLSAGVNHENQAKSALPLIMALQMIFSGVLFQLNDFSSKLSWLMISRWSVEAYGTLVNVNERVPLSNRLGQLQASDPSFIVEPTRHLSFSWGLLCLHTLIYLLIALYLQKRKDRV